MSKLYFLVPEVVQDAGRVRGGDSYLTELVSGLPPLPFDVHGIREVNGITNPTGSEVEDAVGA